MAWAGLPRTAYTSRLPVRYGSGKRAQKIVSAFLKIDFVKYQYRLLLAKMPLLSGLQ
jgi:hypothetical protein